MVRYTIALRGSAKDPTSEIPIQEQVVDIFSEEQLSEHFLCNVNPKGQVPVLTSSALSKPIGDSLDITRYLAKYYPSLIPMRYEDEINARLDALHELNYFSLSFPGRAYVAEGLKVAVEHRLAGDITKRYRGALQYKLAILERDKLGGLKPGVPEAVNERARKLLCEYESILPKQESISNDGKTNRTSGSWLFGLTDPTALDAHLIVFVARMRDVGRSNIVPEALSYYVDQAIKQPEWQALMEDRTTLIGV